jgi:HSP20 family protein
MSKKDPPSRKSEIAPRRGGLISPWQPTGLFTGIDRLFDDFRKSFDEFLSPWVPFTYWPSTARQLELPARYPYLDLVDKGDRYEVTVELPGFGKDQVDVQVTADGLDIRAEAKKETEEKGKTYLHRERAVSTFERRISFPEEVVPEKAEGKMKDGVLELDIPKKEVKAGKRTRISIK